MRRRLAVALASLVLVAPALVPSAASAAPAPTAPRRPVDVFGDSVVAGGAPQIRSRLQAAGWEPRIHAIPGVSIEQVAAAVIGAPNVTDVVVVVLGYSYFWKPFVLRRDVDALLYAMSRRGVRRVIWLDVRENRPERRDVNAAIASATKRWGNLEVADWNRLSLTRDDVFLPDGHHLEKGGGRLMASLILQRLRAYSANAPRAPLPDYGARMTSKPDVAGYGAADSLGAGPKAKRWLSRSPLVGVASTRSGDGYWLARRDGSVRAFGDGVYRGSAVALPLAQPIVGIVATRSGNGYWLVAADGGVFSYGDARFFGSTGAIRLTQPIVGMARTPTGRGYWLVAADGGVFSYGDARFFGSTGAITLHEPIVGMAAHPSGRGYWLVAYDGGIFTFGVAKFRGSGASTPRYWKIAAMAPTADGNGYWLLAANGEVLPYGTATDEGWRPSLTVLFCAMAPRDGGGYWLAAQGPRGLP